MLRTSLTAFIALTLLSSTAQASPYVGAVKIAAAPGYATPGEPAPAPAVTAPTPAPAPQSYAQPTPQPYAQPQPYGVQPQPYGPQPQPYGPQAYGPQPYQEPEKPRRRGKGLMIAGWTMFGASYLSTVFVGAVLFDGTSAVCDAVGGDDCRRSGAGLFVPVVGPLIEIGRAETVTATGTIFGVFGTLVQAAGLSMGIAGTVLFVRDGKARRAQQAGLHLGRGVHLRALPRLDGATMNLSYRF